MAISYLMGLLEDIKTSDSQTRVPLLSLIYGTTASHTDLYTDTQLFCTAMGYEIGWPSLKIPVGNFTDDCKKHL